MQSASDIVQLAGFGRGQRENQCDLPQRVQFIVGLDIVHRDDRRVRWARLGDEN